MSFQKHYFKISLLTGLLLLLGGCGDMATLPEHESIGSHPILPKPNPTLIPTVHIAPAKSWPSGVTPVAASGFSVNAFAKGLDHPRWIYVLPNGDVLVAESDAPTQHDEGSGIKGWIMKLVMKKAGSGVPSPDRITLLRDSNGKGIATEQTILLSGLHSPFGMALIGNDLYVANTDSLLRFPYKTGETHISESGEKILDLPAGKINHHWTKNVIASPDGKHLYVTVGSNSNAAENGLENETGRAAIWEIDPVTKQSHVFASGLRNPNGLSWQPQTGELWTAVNERDEIGSDLVPDYMTSVKQGDFFGWPYSYYGQHLDQRVKPQQPELVAKARVPDYALGTHTASLGLIFYESKMFPQHYFGGAFIGQHGSWNRRPRSGYKVIFVPFKNGHPTTEKPEDILTGFLNAQGEALGRPVGVAVDKTGALLVADDVGNTVWRVKAAATR